MSWGHQYTRRNPKPAVGADVLTLTQLRHYLSLFWSERRYGICSLHGGKAAFLRFVGEEFSPHVTQKLLPESPRSEYLSARLQRVLSRKVLQVLRGQVIFVETREGVTWRPMLGAPEPPNPAELPHRDHEFQLHHTVLGPKIRRLPTGF